MRPLHPKVLIVAARFYDDITDELVAGAEERLAETGARRDLIEVPGAFEIPGTISIVEASGADYCGYVALGCVIRGDTSHYDYVCAESARGLQELAVYRQLAIGYGILTTETREQAWTRARRSHGNKGRDAAEACLTMISIRNCFAAK